MQTRSRAARSVATEATIPPTSPPLTAPAKRTSSKRSITHTTTTSNGPSPAATPTPAKRSKLHTTTAIPSVNISTVVDLTTLDTYLGHLIPIVNGGQAKGGVIAALTQLLPHYDSSSSVTHYPHHLNLPSFNRLSGYLRLHNAVCLFINIPPPTTQQQQQPLSNTSLYPNAFTRHKQRVYCDWYTPTAVQPTNPLVPLLVGARAASKENSEDAVSVLLFCRRVGGSGGVEGYRYWGRVAYVSHDETVRPMQFALELVDAKRVEAVLRQDQKQQQQADDGDNT